MTSGGQKATMIIVLVKSFSRYEQTFPHLLRSFFQSVNP